MFKKFALFALMMLAPFAAQALEPIDHCRIVDTAIALPSPYHMQVGVDYQFNATLPSFTSQGGENRDCGVPVGARAILATVTIRDPYGPGYWRMWPTGGNYPYAVSGTFGRYYDSYVTNYSLASGRTVLVQLDEMGNFMAEVSIYGITRFIVDVEGYVP